MILRTRRARQGWRWRTTAFGGFGLDCDSAWKKGPRLRGDRRPKGTPQAIGFTMLRRPHGPALLQDQKRAMRGPDRRYTPTSVKQALRQIEDQ
jgi:hypothetical protein